MDMYTFNHAMTVVYSTITGNIKAVIQGEQTINSLYGEDAEAYDKFKTLTTGINNMIMHFPTMYKVNLETKAIEIK